MPGLDELAQWIDFAKGGPGSGAQVGHAFNGNQYGTGEAMRDIANGQQALLDSVKMGTQNLTGNNVYRSVRDDDHIADAKAALVEGHMQLAHNALHTGDTAARTAHLAAAYKASSMPDPDHGDSSEDIYQGAQQALTASTNAVSNDKSLRG